VSIGYFRDGGSNFANVLTVLERRKLLPNAKDMIKTLEPT
jgi:hypothetical protein